MEPTTPIQPPKGSDSYSPSIKTEHFNSNNEKQISSSSWLKQSKPDFSVSLKSDTSTREKLENHVNSSNWLGLLKREISEPDIAEPSIFADAEEEENQLPSQDVAALRFSSGDSNVSGLELLSHSASHVFNLATISLDNPGMQPLIELPENRTDERASTLDKLKTLGILESTENSVQAGIRNHFPTTPPSLVVQNADQIPDDVVKEWDILSGRGGKSNHHPGNKRFRQVVDEMKLKYRTTNVKTDKTALSKAIVDYVEGYGGRFLTRKNAKPGHYRVMAKAESRKKTSQALRETKELKWKLNSSSPPV